MYNETLIAPSSLANKRHHTAVGWNYNKAASQQDESAFDRGAGGNYTGRRVLIAPRICLNVSGQSRWSGVGVISRTLRDKRDRVITFALR